MNALKIIGIVIVVYAAIVIAFEATLGYFQPAGGSSLRITVTNDDGSPHERVVTRIDSDGQLYVAANHWPRAWYNQVRKHPDVQVVVDGVAKPYLAVPVTPAEHERLDREHALGPMVRILTGFPPRKFVRLDPR